MNVGIMQPIHPQTLIAQPRPPIRRATYIHVSDLTNAYNIDHKKLWKELARVQTEELSLGEHPCAALPTDPSEDSVASVPQKRLQPPRGGFNLCVLVGKVNVVVDKLRVDRSRVRLAEVEVGDETGIVSLRARDEQIDLLESISKLNSAVVLRNCSLELFQGKHIRLAVTKWGKLSKYPDTLASTPPPPSKINVDRNFSKIDLSMVASEMVENSPPEAGYSGSSPEIPHDRTRPVSTRQQQFQPPRHFQQPQRTLHGGQIRRLHPRHRGTGANPMSMPFPEVPSMGYPIDPTRYTGMQQGYTYGEMTHFPLDARQGQHRLLQPQQGHILLYPYELQHQQMRQQQMHAQAYREQQGMQQAMLQRRHQMQSTHLVQNILTSSTFDTQGDYNSRGLPMIPDHSIAAPVHPPLPHSPEGRSDLSQSVIERSAGGLEGPSNDHEAWRSHVGRVLDEYTMSPGRMNPQATSFSPTYGEAQQQGPQRGPQLYGYQYMSVQQPRITIYPPYQHQHHHPEQTMMYAPIQDDFAVHRSSVEGVPARNRDISGDQVDPAQNQPDAP